MLIYILRAGHTCDRLSLLKLFEKFRGFSDKGRNYIWVENIMASRTSSTNIKVNILFLNFH